ncbi:YtzH-like family protein [Bacillus sp. 03113]|uniref:YtzH-like family protein n=1 Tax=Bacillus sp. 03113 TaxID=2578211 RepID=UPI001144FA80|nr:YtzH-like family protein [Bacillus sp. 03113]
MPISQQDQMNLLKDILNNHKADCCGTVSECEQLERLIKSLMVKTNMDSNGQTLFEDIYQYSQHGINSANLNQHIESHQEDLSKWVNDIDQFSL